MIAWHSPAVIAMAVFGGVMRGFGYGLTLIYVALIHNSFGNRGMLIAAVLFAVAILLNTLLAKVGIRGTPKPEPIDIGRDLRTIEKIAFFGPFFLTLGASLYFIARLYQWI